MSLTLSIADLSVTLKQFLDSKYPRARVDPHPSVEFSIYGATVGDGPLFEGKHIWSVNATVNAEQERGLGAIFQEFDRLRRIQQNANILIIDTNQEIQERGTRTRAIAPSASISNVGNNYISYYAQFYGWMTTPPTFDFYGKYRSANFVLTETEKVTL